MIASKDAAIEILKKMPKDSTLEDIMYEIDVIAQIIDGLKDAEAGKLISTEELLRRVDQWEK